MYFFSRNLKENLIFRDENKNIFLSISCFETRTRNRNAFLEVEREKMKLIITGIPGYGNFRHSLDCIATINDHEDDFVDRSTLPPSLSLVKIFPTGRKAYY